MSAEAAAGRASSEAQQQLQLEVASLKKQTTVLQQQLQQQQQAPPPPRRGPALSPAVAADGERLRTRVTELETMLANERGRCVAQSFAPCHVTGLPQDTVRC